MRFHRSVGEVCKETSVLVAACAGRADASNHPAARPSWECCAASVLCAMRYLIYSIRCVNAVTLAGMCLHVLLL